MNRIPKPDFIEERYYTYRPYTERAILNPTGDVVHSTATPGVPAREFSKLFDTASRGASVHGFLDPDRFCLNIPFNRRAGHVGSGKNGSGNNTHIGIEWCEPKGLVYNNPKDPNVYDKKKPDWCVLSYKPEDPTYFRRIWEKGVWLYAWLCQEYNIDPLANTGTKGISGHYEMAAMGYGDNHGDPRGWWECEGVTMDDFRRAVHNKLYGEEDENVPRYNTIAEVPTWGRPTVQKLINDKAITGSGAPKDPQGNPTDMNLSDDMLRVFVVNDRLGLYK